MPHHHPELEGDQPQALYTVQLRRRGQTLIERVTWGLLGIAVGIGGATALFVWSETPWSWPRRADTTSLETDDPFQKATHQAMAAAELTQTAEFQEEWVEVLWLWQQATTALKAVPKNHPNYAIADQKIAEYSRNAQYAESNVRSRPPRAPADPTYWTVGSDRDWVVAIQGVPSRVLRYDASCQEILHYGNSTVDLKNGYVRQYANLEGNLRSLADAPLVQSTQATPQSWTMGSHQSEVLRIEGAPSRTEQYYASDRHYTLYFGQSSVLFEDDYVIGYLDVDRILKVSLTLAESALPASSPDQWTIGSSRGEVLRVQQQPPSAITRNDNRCEEIWQFGDSEVVFRQGFVSGYRNTGQSLRIR
ncbi:MAG: hypothetical protein ACHWZW_02205 [Spirulina sp.]